MDRKHLLNQLAAKFSKVVLNPVNAVCIDNPDSLFVSDNGLVGVFIPTTEEYKNTDHLLRRLWFSRMVYTEQMRPLVVLDTERYTSLNLDVLDSSFGNILPYENLEDTVKFINRKVDNVKGVSQKVRQEAFLHYYYILEYFRNKEHKEILPLGEERLNGESVPVKSWSRDVPTFIRKTYVDANQNQLVFRKKNNQSFRNSMNSLLTYSMLLRYDYSRHSLYLNNWYEEQFLSVNTDFEIWGGDHSESGVYLRTLAFHGILPMNVTHEGEYMDERSSFMDFIYSKKRRNG